MIPLVIVVVAIAGVAAGLAYVNSKFDAVNQVSAPPPQIEGSDLGVTADLKIDTGPAQEAIREAESRDAAEDDDGGDLTPPTQDPGPASASTTSADGTNTTTSSGASDGTTTAEGSNAGAPSTRSDSVTILLMGVDAREGEAIDIGVRPDSLAVINLNPDRGDCRILSIPRDSRVELPGYGQSKINHALAVGGIPYEVLVVENVLGVTLDHYGLIDFSGVESLVDAVGGVTVENDGEFSHGGHFFPAGEITLNGAEALAYSRFRFDERGDFGRQERQQQIMRALLGEISGPNTATRIPSLLDTVEGHVRTDLGPGGIVDLARTYQPTCGAGTLETDRVEGSTGTRFDDLLGMDLSFVMLDDSDLERKVAWLTEES